MYIAVRNNPEEAGYHIEHAKDEDHADADHEQKIPLGVVFKTIARKPMVWVTAGAYFCTGVVRTAQFGWWVVYFKREWGLDIASPPRSWSPVPASDHGFPWLGKLRLYSQPVVQGPVCPGGDGFVCS